MRLSALFPLTTMLFVSSLTINAHADGGFVGLQGGITDSQDMDNFNNNVRLTFGPDITERLSLEMGLMDMGEASYEDPEADFTGVNDDTPPSFTNSARGTVTSATASGGEQAYATYTGFSSAHPQSFLITLRYRFPLLDNLDFFLKTGANIWWADYEITEITAYQDGSLTKTVDKKGQTSAVDQISGGGFIWDVMKDMSIRAELETTALDSKAFERVRFQLMTLGLQYDF
ncbi:MAG: hypothetical protein CMI02_15235 [Oceanospirillaceae bacterium]|nr:hypothetical protein [Oceanospirillaceae bacterium]MBT13377.1 hypothetical protein [Oceanospirillaceae bacterium]|tara:strand:+ start:26868 stop:27557 length:690 start_codon:yes stop_codon:yes gene_type:complete